MLWEASQHVTHGTTVHGDPITDISTRLDPWGPGQSHRVLGAWKMKEYKSAEARRLQKPESWEMLQHRLPFLGC